MFFKKAKRIKFLENEISNLKAEKNILNELFGATLSDVVTLEAKYKVLKNKHNDLHDKHWSECWQIGEYDNDLRRVIEENRRLKAKVEQLEAVLTVDNYLND